MKRAMRVPVPESFALARDMLLAFENICQRSLSRLARKYTPPSTVVSCRLLGVPKHQTVGQGDFRTIVEEDGRAVELLLVGHVPSVPSNYLMDAFSRKETISKFDPINPRRMLALAAAAFWQNARFLLICGECERRSHP